MNSVTRPVFITFLNYTEGLPNCSVPFSSLSCIWQTRGSKPRVGLECVLCQAKISPPAVAVTCCPTPNMPLQLGLFTDFLSQGHTTQHKKEDHGGGCSLELKAAGTKVRMLACVCY